MNIPVQFSTKQTIEGHEPIVILGPNGSGKTRYGLQLADWNKADMIAALRNIALPENIPMQSLTQAEQELLQQKQNRRRRPWSISNEINNLFAKLMVEDSAAAIEFREKYVSNPNLKPKVTKLMRLASAWQYLFPGRYITFGGYVPKVTSEYVAGEKSYAAQQMSDGERVALYLAGRVLDSDTSVIVVDEPEVHFHSRLAVQFWDELERIRNDCRFVYITHDLTFALSRQTSQFLIVHPGREPDLVDLSKGIPSEISEQVLSAASFSIFADTLIFCEGTESSLDQRFLRAWYKERRTAVIPVGSCRDVIRCVTTFRNNDLLTNVNAIGLIDQDYWPDAFIGSLPDGVTILPVHEIESLFCHRGLFKAVAAHLGKQESEADVLYDEFLTQSKERFVESLLHKQISERFRARCEQYIRESLNNFEINNELESVKVNHCTLLSPQNWVVKPENIFDEEVERLNQAISGGENDFLRMFPGKVYLGILIDKIGLDKSSYTDLITNALKSELGSELYTLSESVRQSLIGIFPKVS